MCKYSDCKHKSKNSNEFPKENKDWPRWGHDNHNTFSSEDTKICKDNLASMTQKWNFDLSVYSPYGPDSGEFTYASAIVVDGTTYLLSGYGIIYAIDSDGNLIPTFGATVYPFIPGIRFIDDPDTIYTTSLSTPLVMGDYIYTATQRGDNDGLLGFFVNAINRFTGENNPTWPTNGANVPIYPSAGHTLAEALNTTEITTSVTSADSLIFISVTNAGFDAFQRGAVSAFDLNGNLVWSEIIEPNSGAGTGSWSTPSFDTERKLMFFGTSNAKDLPDSSEVSALQARNYKTGELAWNYQYVPNDVAGNAYPFGIGNPTYMMDRDVGSSPNVFTVCCHGKKRELVGACGKDGFYRAINRKDGTLAWQTIISLTPTIWGNPSAAYHDGVIYAVTSSDIDLELVGSADPVPYQSYSQLILGSGQEFATLKSYLYSKGIVCALDAKSGKILWKKEFPSLIWGSATYANGIVYVGSYDGTIRFLNAKTGDVIYSTTTIPQVTFPGVPLSEYVSIPANITVSDGVAIVPYLSLTTSSNGFLALSPESLCDKSIEKSATSNNSVQKVIPKFKEAIGKLMAKNKTSHKFPTKL